MSRKGSLATPSNRQVEFQPEPVIHNIYIPTSLSQFNPYISQKYLYFDTMDCTELSKLEICLPHENPGLLCLLKQ